MDSPDAFDTPRAALSTPLLQRNRLLGALSTEARLRLLPSVDLVQVRTGQSLDPARGAARRAYFPITAMASVCQVSPSGESTQVALVGPEGMVGFPLLTGSEAPWLRSTVQLPGAVLAVDGARLAQEFRRGDTTTQVLLGYMHTLMAQMAQAALCHRHHSIEQQLARWLLATADRMAVREIASTQEMVAGLLGVRREGVTEAAGRLRDAGLIACRRGHFTLLDTRGLRARACSCYAVLQSGQDSGAGAGTAGQPPRTGTSTTEQEEQSHPDHVPLAA
ncbi:Crp/Fnr family transcriptional regulator [Ramlibacter sp.]|uniref:Crp/Fnr family transcriptional regulator n=1 Tax=Ramlibacter sp. TaxID=1917967 RepID=UPI00185536C1|nr:Crp/Fnr family transcriptional regulator [Ramlibacter sp.]MBA2676661.1 Crp/Fnr family transcriptional regulator [Ramlibacter sp.]